MNELKEIKNEIKRVREDLHQRKLLKELIEMNKTLSSIRTFMIAEAQLIKSLLLEQKKQLRLIKKMEEKWPQLEE